jgi:hypothetical protein
MQSIRPSRLPFSVKTQPLTAAEQARVDDAIAAFIQMAEDAGLLDEELALDTPELADELLIRWASEPRQARLPDEVIATIVGAAVGDYLRQLLRVTWAGEGAGQARSIGLAAEESGEPVVSPFDAVRERLGQASEGFVQDLFDELAAEWSGLRREPLGG